LAGQLNFFASNSSVRPVSGTEVRSVCYGNPSDSAAGYLSSDEVTGMYDDYWGAAGVRARHGADDALRFFQATPTNEDIDQLTVDIATACECWLSARGFSGEAHDDGPDVGEDDAQGLLQLASLMAHCNKPMKLRSIVIREPATMRVVSGLLRCTGPPAQE